MNISVIGLGYVGTVSAACFASLGNQVLGYEVNPKKADKLRRGIPPVNEPGLHKLLKHETLHKRRVRIVNSFDSIVKDSEMTFVCVGTPISTYGALDTKYLESTCRDLASALKKNKGTGHIVVIRSSIVPGTVDKLRKIFVDRGLEYGKDFYLASNPELLREGTAVDDFMHPPHIIVGAEEQEVADRIASVYKGIDTKIMKMSLKTGELLKLVDNAWHAVKMSFANEVASICKSQGVDTHELLKIFCSDKVLNISPYYLERPSIGFGGSCLPKDIVALERIARDAGLHCSLLNSTSQSNINQIKRALEVVKNEARRAKTKKLGFYGVAFKPGTDDVRGSPIIYLINNLRSNGFDVKIFDPIVKKEEIANIRNSYRNVINDPLMNTLLQIDNFKDILPIVEERMISEEWVLDNDIIVMNTRIPLQSLLKLNEHQVIVDMQGVTPQEDLKQCKAKYVSVVK